ncbi:MAG: hypothetical protein ACN4GT_02800 [Gammaproteobacteria bacterium]
MIQILRQRRVTPVAILLVSLIGILAGCGGEPEVRTEPVALSGNIIVPDGVPADATVYVSLYHAWALEGDLRHPVEFIEGFEGTAGEFTHEFDYPVDAGEGLLVYAWIDSDADGILCTPTVRVDRAGLTEVDGFVPGDVTVDVELTAPCAGPDWFYPPAE